MAALRCLSFIVSDPTRAAHHRSILCRYFPIGLLGRIIKSPEHAFDTLFSNTENPELIWNQVRITFFFFFFFKHIPFPHLILCDFFF